MNLEELKVNSSSSKDGKLCQSQIHSANDASIDNFDSHHPFINQSGNVSFEAHTNEEGEDESPISLSQYRYVFLLAQIFHGIGASALISLGVTYLDESVNKKDAPLFIGIFEASFVLGPAIG